MRKQTLFFTILWMIAGIGASAGAEVGIGAGASFNYKATWRSAPVSQPRATDPGAALSGIDHFYDDGYNRVDSSANFGNKTTYWGYQNASQNDGSSITFNSSQTTIEAGSTSSAQTEAQPALEIYWQEQLTENKRWNVGLRAAGRWQQIDLHERSAYRATIETISDTYSYSGIAPGAPFNGSFAGPNFLLSDIPVRSTTTTPGATIRAHQTLEADIFGFDFGPTLSLNLTERLSIDFSVGGTLAWIRSDFSYRDETSAAGGNSHDEWLAGMYGSADLQYLIGERWGVFAGVIHTRLEDVDRQADGRSVRLEFDDSYTVRTGLFFQ